MHCIALYSPFAIILLFLLLWLCFFSRCQNEMSEEVVSEDDNELFCFVLFSSVWFGSVLFCFVLFCFVCLASLDVLQFGMVRFDGPHVKQKCSFAYVILQSKVNRAVFH